MTVLLVLAAIGGLFAFVYPTSTFLRQRSQLEAGEARISELERQADRLERQNQQLLGDSEVERIAREQYGLVRPGETPYVLVPMSPTTTTTPTTKTTTKPSTSTSAKR